MGLSAHVLLDAASHAGFELAGLTAPEVPDFERYRAWVSAGHAGRMSYLTDHRADVRGDPRLLLPSVRTILCVGKLYNTAPAGNDSTPAQGWVSRYTWGSEDYHRRLRDDLEAMIARLQTQHGAFEYRVCVDTAPLLERSLARRAGLGWIGKNTCLINQQQGSWFFLAEVLLSVDVDAHGEAPPDRCGTCARCIEACPTQAIVPDGAGGWTLDARLCISYFTIELKGPIPEEHRTAMGNHVYGCDICQDVCPWNRRAAFTEVPGFQPTMRALDLEELSTVTPPAFRGRRADFLRNVAVAMGNSGDERFREPLQRMLESSAEPVLREHVEWALRRIR